MTGSYLAMHFIHFSNWLILARMLAIKAVRCASMESILASVLVGSNTSCWLSCRGTACNGIAARLVTTGLIACGFVVVFVFDNL